MIACWNTLCLLIFAFVCDSDFNFFDIEFLDRITGLTGISNSALGASTRLETRLAQDLPFNATKSYLEPGRNFAGRITAIKAQVACDMQMWVNLIFFSLLLIDPVSSGLSRLIQNGEVGWHLFIISYPAREANPTPCVCGRTVFALRCTQMFGYAACNKNSTLTASKGKTTRLSSVRMTIPAFRSAVISP